MTKVTHPVKKSPVKKTTNKPTGKAIAHKAAPKGKSPMTFYKGPGMKGVR